MPELPEVETVAAGVHAKVAGDVIQSVWFSSQREPFKTPATEMETVLAGRRILRVHRIGKHIVCDLGSGKGRGSAHAHVEAQWIVHLGMTGRLLACSPDDPVAPHTHAVLELASGRELRFVDPRRFGRLSLHPIKSVKGEEGGASSGFHGTGQEPLSISPEAFASLFHSRRTPIKAALLNQKLLQGVGNIYADESLFHAAIRPRRLACRLTRAELGRLHSSLVKVLREAIAQGGSSVSDYVDANGARGFFQLQHHVYLRTGKPCFVCGTPIRRILIGGRGTHYCPACQS
ncbi:MAG TPA: bifunctional DNA-formamidopyrimidine glycosylase/DNA-(apurinic or apyrimidinic site) lyase [Acidisarcina sp.]|nr:bifunctional DNA-formamidopyrimidine glycosylase/DNA-(apurinic or apyrimidinic site) lyase [Acidisarcina sp.]